MKCENCAYYWKEENDTFMTCHFIPYWGDDYPPCDLENYVRQSEKEREYLSQPDV